MLGAETDPAARGPRVAAGMEVRAAGGAIVVKVDPTAIVPDPRGRLGRLIGLRVDGWAPGDYELVLDVRDEVAGARVEQRVPFCCGRINQSEFPSVSRRHALLVIDKAGDASRPSPDLARLATGQPLPMSTHAYSSRSGTANSSCMMADGPGRGGGHNAV